MSGPPFRVSPKERLALAACALGREPADLYIRGARVVDVNVGDVWEANIAVKGGRIAYVGSAGNMVGDTTEVVEADGRFAVPGLFEAHGHGEFFYNPAHLAALVAARGTTAAFFDFTDLAAVAGAAGLKRLLEESEVYPLRYFVGPPAVKYELSGGPMLTDDDLEELLQHERVLSLAELTEWMAVSALDEDIIGRIARARNLGKRAEGHTVGATKQRLQALSAAGITSTHEPVSADQAIEALRAGMWTMLRHGTVRKDLDATLPALLEAGVTGSPKLLLTTDVVTPLDLVREGYLDWTVRMAVSLGMPVLQAIRCATLNPAIYFGLDQDLGQIAPGRLADFFLCGSLEELRADEVYFGGRLISKSSEPADFPRGFSVSSLTQPYGLADVSTDLLVYSAPPESAGTCEVPAVDIVNLTITQQKKVTLPVDGVAVLADRESGVMKLAGVARDGSKSSVTFIKGFTGDVEAYASSLSDEMHDSVLVLGYDDEEMLAALRRVGELGGGLVLRAGGKVAAEVALAEGGLMTAESWSKYLTAVSALYDAFRALGCDLEDPPFTVRFLSFLGLPSVRLTPEGLYDTMRGRVVTPAHGGA